MSLNFKTRVRINQQSFDAAYNALPFESKRRDLNVLATMLSAPKSSIFTTNKHLTTLFGLLKETIQEAGIIYQDIRKARKQLFTGNHTKKPSCELDLEEWRSDDWIDWSFNEPYFRMATKVSQFGRCEDRYGEPLGLLEPFMRAGWHVPWVAEDARFD